MDNTRIIYKKDDDGNLVTQDFFANGIMVKGKILTGSNRAVYLLKLKDGEYKCIKATSWDALPKAKRQVKQFMKEFGVKFFEEVRKK